MARSDRKRVGLAAAVVVAVPLLVACNAIIGLNDFDKVECPGRRCADGGGTTDGPLNPDVVTDAPADARGADPVSWAQWPMPNYDGGADFLDHPLKYNPLGDGKRVEDVVTGLVWRTAVLPTQASLDDAKRACAELDQATGPWRLPKRIELVTLLDFGRTSTLVDPVFTGVKNVRIWTSSELRPLAAAGAQQQYWTVDFGTGAVDTLPASDNVVANVLCVKGKS